MEVEVVEVKYLLFQLSRIQFLWPLLHVKIWFLISLVGLPHASGVLICALVLLWLCLY